MTDNLNTLADRLEPCPFCKAELEAPSLVRYPKTGLARMHPGTVDDGSCPIAGWGFYDEQLVHWNTRAHPQPTGDVGALVERLGLHKSWRDSHGELNDAPNQAAATILALAAEVERKDAVIAEANVSRNILRDTIRLLGIQVKGLAAALNGYRAAVSYIAADSWDGCSDCIEILRLARAADYDWHWTPDKIATELAALRAAIGKAEQ